ncbi:hemagglutinin repeat-containing protein [Herbaspirillum sp. Sphag1AN]|uniref:hemagglutinin repeat-containing protein n=1 Tax=Herbaspirillum sp. Sphag1AN TaxID=2587030 RepID=UPI001C866CED
MQVIEGRDKQPTVSIDLSQMGGMYANHIRLIGTEAGVGVRSMGNIAAQAGDIQIDSSGKLTFIGDTTATGKIAIQGSDTISNSGQLAAQQALTINTSGQLDNTGLLNSQTDTVLRAADIHNLGQIYGNDIALGTTTLRNDVNNDVENDKAGVIAARNTLQIGAAEVINREHALLQSQGDMSIGGTLNADNQVTGEATSILNASATIDAGGALRLQSAELNNRNDHFSTTEEDDFSSARHVTEYAAWNAPDVWFSADQIRWSDSGNGGIVLVIPDGNRFEKFYKRDYTEIVRKTVVQSSDPARISAGGDLLLSGRVTNDKSQIIAGGKLIGTVDALNNIGATGTGTPIRKMTARQNYYHWVSGSSHTNNYNYDNDGAAYDNVLAPVTIALAIGTITPDATPDSGLPGIPLPPLPDNGFFKLHPQPDHHTLVETDPQFTNYKTFLSSDYLISRLALDPQTIQKRLGDGYYEQKLIADQLGELTGKRQLSTYSNAEAQYQALMEAGVATATAFQLTPGIALTAAQMAALTADIVWLVAQTVTLPDGSSTRVLAPVVYLRQLAAADIAPSGTLMAAADINLNVNGSLANSGTLRAANQLILGATDIHNSGTLHSTGNADTDGVILTAGHDLVSNGHISGNRVGILAGNDVTLASTTASHNGANGLNTGLKQISSIAAGELSIQAGRDVSLVAATIQTSGDASITAGRDLQLDTIKTQQTDKVRYDRDNHLNLSSTQVIGTGIDSGGTLTLAAGQDIHARAADVNAEGALTAIAGRDVKLDTAQQESQIDQAIYTTTSGPLSSASSRSQRNDNSTAQIGSTFSGDRVSILAGRDIDVTGSNVVATKDLTLAAVNDIRISTSQDTSDSRFKSEEKRSGIMSSGASITAGTRQENDAQTSHQVSNNASTLGSTNGHVSISAGKTYTQTGSDVLALTGNIDIDAQAITIQQATDTSASTQDHQFKQTGITVSVTSPVLSAMQSVQQLKQAASKTDNSRMQALAAGAAGLTAYSTYNSLNQASSMGDVVSLNVSVGTSQSESHTEQNSSTARGATVVAGGNLSLRATGGGNASDLTMQGSQIKAGNNITLEADHDITLLAAQNTSAQHSTNSNSSASVGVSVSASGNVGVNASVAGGKGYGDGDDVTQINTQVEAGKQLTLRSGSDTTLRGATTSGQQVTVNVGTNGSGNLHIDSLQDTSTYEGRQQSMGVSVAGGTGTASGAVNVSRSKVDGSYASVNAQSGILAGDGGFTVNVNGNTNLTGAKIASTAQAVTDNKNSLTTHTLTQSSIANHDDYQADSMSAGISISHSDAKPVPGKPGQMTDASTKMNGTGLGYGSTSGSDSSSTDSGISGGTITITDAAAQEALTGKTVEQTLATIDTTVRSDEDSSNKLSKNWDGQQLMEDVNAQTQIRQAFGQQAAKLIGDYATNKENDLRQQARKETDPTKRAALLKEANEWSEDGFRRIALHTISGAMTGGLAGAAGAAGSSLAMTAITEQLGKTDLPEVLKQGLAQIAAGAIGAAAGGNAGMAAAVNVEANNRQLHQSEKDLIAKKANGDKDKEARLTQAACYAVKCWSQYPEGSKEYNANFVDVMTAYSLKDETAWINEQQTKGQFVYSMMNEATDRLQSTHIPVIKDGVKVATGWLTATGGLALCGSGLGCVAGGPMTAFGGSAMIEGGSGLYNAYNGSAAPGVNPLRNQFNQFFPVWGNATYDGLNFLATFMAMGVQVPLKVGISDGINRTESLFGVTVSGFRNATLNPLTKLPLPYGTTQAILLYGTGSQGATLINDVRKASGSK